jgi:lipopolysaccharide export system protein LptC
MARGYGTYSRFVALFKILLPLVALVVLGTVFLFTSENTIESGLTFSRADVANLEAGNFIRNPQIDGQTTSGAPFFLTADEIKRQDDDENLLKVTALKGVFHDSTGGTVHIASKTAIIDMLAQTVVFNEGGEIVTSDGNMAEVKTLIVNLATGELSGTGIEADGPLGHISADDFRIESKDGENHVLWFENNVRMLYDL